MTEPLHPHLDEAQRQIRSLFAQVKAIASQLDALNHVTRGPNGSPERGLEFRLAVMERAAKEALDASSKALEEVRAQQAELEAVKVASKVKIADWVQTTSGQLLAAAVIAAAALVMHAAGWGVLSERVHNGPPPSGTHGRTP